LRPMICYYGPCFLECTCFLECNFQPMKSNGAGIMEFNDV